MMCQCWAVILFLFEALLPSPEHTWPAVLQVTSVDLKLFVGTTAGAMLPFTLFYCWTGSMSSGQCHHFTMLSLDAQSQSPLQLTLMAPQLGENNVVVSVSVSLDSFHGPCISLALPCMSLASADIVKTITGGGGSGGEASPPTAMKVRCRACLYLLWGRRK